MTANKVRTSWENTTMDEVKIWTVDDASNAVSLKPTSQVDAESLLEETFVRNPDLLMPGLMLVGRQTPTPGGPLDLLGVDSDGRLVVFELKRGTLYRDAVAQIIDYASDLDSKSDSTLAEHISDNSGVGGIGKIDDFQEWYSQEFPDSEGLRPMRLFLVGLGADDRTERMVRFLADKNGMAISLLTFHGFAYDGKTLLARQVEVEGAAEPNRHSSRPYLSVAERQERLEALVEKCAVSDLFSAVRGMFGKSWHRLTEYIGPTAIGFHLSEQIESRWRTRSYARAEPVPGKVRLVFYGRTVRLCSDDFDQVKQEIQSETYTSPSDTEGTYMELMFPLDAADWHVHKERLHALTRAVYEAWESRDHLEDSA